MNTTDKMCPHDAQIIVGAALQSIPLGLVTIRPVVFPASLWVFEQKALGFRATAHADIQRKLRRSCGRRRSCGM